MKIQNTGWVADFNQLVLSLKQMFTGKKRFRFFTKKAKKNSKSLKESTKVTIKLPSGNNTNSSKSKSKEEEEDIMKPEFVGPPENMLTYEEEEVVHDLYPIRKMKRTGNPSNDQGADDMDSNNLNSLPFHSPFRAPPYNTITMSTQDTKT